MLRLPDDLKGSLDEQLHSAQRRNAQVITFLAPLEPGHRRGFAVDLAPGRYGLVCNIPNLEGKTTHALQGMNSDLWVE